VLEVGCSFGHMTEYLAEQPEIATLSTFDPDAAFVEIAPHQGQGVRAEGRQRDPAARPGGDAPSAVG
jgi:trans-aconitate methyltransferase